MDKIEELNGLDVSLFDISEIESIEFIGEYPTIDITVEDTHMFFANGVYSHNSGLDGEIIEAGSVSKSFEKLFVADFIMSFQRKPEDKLNGTARAHVIKNRYGADGMTFPSKFNANNGNIILYNDSSLEGKSLKENMNKGDVGVKNYLNSQYKILMNKED